MDVLVIDVLSGRVMKRQAKRDPESLLPLPLTVLHILLALADGDKHGYGMMKEVAGRTEGKVRLGPGTLYGGIKRLLEDGLIEKSDERPDPELDDERRQACRHAELHPIFGRPRFRHHPSGSLVPDACIVHRLWRLSGFPREGSNRSDAERQNRRGAVLVTASGDRF